MTASAFRTFALAAALFGSAAAPAAAQETAIPEIVRRVTEKYYNPAAAGLRDVQVEVKSARFQKVLPGATVRVYWKAPGRKAARIENAPAPMAARVPALEKQLSALAFDVVPRGLVEQVKESEVRVEEEKGLTHLVFSPKRGTPDAGTITHYWFDADLKLVRRIVESVVGGKPHRTELTHIVVEEVEGRYFLREMKGTSAGEPVEIRWEYAKAGAYWLPVRSVRTMGKEQEITEYANPAVDAGLDDALFGAE